MRQLDDVLDLLARYHQRATYGAVGGVVDRPAAFVMTGLPRDHRHSWVVNADTLLPTGYAQKELHPALCEREHVFKSASEFEQWLRKPE
jgi:hypothetical protein